MRTKSANDVLRLTEEMRSENPLTAATAYIAAGLKLVVTHGIASKKRCTCGDRSCTHPGKHPIAEFFPHGAIDATDDITVVRKAFRAVPEANLAITLGNLTVVDIDGPDGKAAVDALTLPKSIAVKTGRGRHRYFLGTLASGGFKAKQVDVLTGANRYVMAPPSMHESGRRYRWLLTVASRAASVPDDILRLREISGRAHAAPIGRRIIRLGERNDILFRTACSLRRRIGNSEAIFEMMKVMNEQACEMPLSDSELRTAIASSERYDSDEDELFGSPKDVKALPMEWLWYPYIPRFGVTIIAGDPGRGKSLLIALLVAIVSSGKQWPLSDEPSRRNKVLLLSAEDNWARVTLARLLKAGATIENVHVMHKFRALTVERLERLSSEMETWRPDLVVIDTLSAYMGGARDMHRQNEVGEFLAMLTEMAESIGCAIVGLGHLNKQSNTEPLYRIVGSIGFAASIRSALFLGADPSDRTRLALAHGKANASIKGKTIVFEIEGGGRSDVPIVRPVGFSDADADDVCRVDKNNVGRPSSEREEAIEFVLDFLDDRDAVAWDSVSRAADARSIASDGTLNIVRAELSKSGAIVQVGKGRNARWKLGKAQKRESEA